LVKPVRREDLLTWVGERLGLVWVFRPTETPPVLTSLVDAAACFQVADLHALADLARLGYYRGFVQRLDALAPVPAPAEVLVRQWRAWARSFHFEAIAQQLQEVLDAHQSHGR